MKEREESDGLPCSESLMNLSLLDPSRFGWTAVGGIADLLTPHERSRRRSTCASFRKQKIRSSDSGIILNEGTPATPVTSTTSCSSSIPLASQLPQQATASVEVPVLASSQNGVNLPTSNDNNHINQSMGSDFLGMSLKPVENIESQTKGENEHLKNSRPTNVIESTVTSVKDGVLDMYAYHRGRECMEPRDDETGELLCVPIATDTNHHNDAPKMKLTILVEFPLEDERKNDNAKKQKQALYRESMQWDLGDPSTPSPLAFATNIADEFGLSFGQLMDLSLSIQDQIDTHLKHHFHYSSPLALKDPYQNERNFAEPTRYTHRFDQVLRTKEGGIPLPMKERTSRPQRAAPGPNRQYSRSSNRSSTGTAQKQSKRRNYDVFEFVDEEEIEEEYVIEAKKRGKEASKAVIRESGKEGILAEQNNYVCHICHKRAHTSYGFPCGHASHFYCTMHCEQRLDLSVDKSPVRFDYCPICSLNCSCSACARKASNVARQLKKVCEQQNKSASQAIFDNVLERCLKASKNGTSRVYKKSKHDESSSKTPKPVEKGRPSRPLSERKLERFKIKGPRVKKPPISDFPSEMTGSVQLESAKLEDYMKIYTAYGSFKVDNFPEAWITAAQDKSDDSDEAVIEDGNVDYCHICKKAGKLVCCDRCPRAFHEKCFKEESANGENSWQCMICDKEIAGFEDDKIEGSQSLEKILATFEGADVSSGKKGKGIKVLSIVHEMLEKLIDYDFGFMFQEPVQDVEGYSDIVKHPMDLGTIISKLENGDYADLFKKTDSIDKVVSTVLKDIELVWHNCFLFNSVDSAIYRMANVHKRRVQSFRRQSFEDLLSKAVKENVEQYVLLCDKERAKSSSQTDIRSAPATNEEKLLRTIRPRGTGQIPARGVFNAASKIIAILDPSSGRIVKVYSSMTAAKQACKSLSNLGHKCEWETLDLKSIIHQGALDPSVLLYGYRWLQLEDLRSNRVSFVNASHNAIEMKHNDATYVYFSADEAVSYAGIQKDVNIDSLSSMLNGMPVGPEWAVVDGISWRRYFNANDNEIIGENTKRDIGQMYFLKNSVALKEDSITKRKLVGFDTISAAFDDWVKSVISSPTFPASESKSMETFQTDYLDGNHNVDGMVWKSVKMALEAEAKNEINERTFANENTRSMESYPDSTALSESNDILGEKSMEVDSKTNDSSMIESGNADVNQNLCLTENKSSFSMTCGGATVKPLQSSRTLGERHHGDAIRLISNAES